MLTRIIQWAFAPEAIRESVINAFVRRGWTRPANIEVALYDDRMEMINPGALPDNVTVERMKQGLHIPRNPILIQTLKLKITAMWNIWVWAYAIKSSPE